MPNKIRTQSNQVNYSNRKKVRKTGTWYVKKNQNRKLK
jgi:hypothetical protein